MKKYKFDYTKYSFDGGHTFFNKRRFVLAFIKDYIAEHPFVTYNELETIFNLGNYNKTIGVVRPLSFVNEMIKTVRPNWINKFFLKPDEIIELRDGTRIVINSDWGNGGGKMEKFLTIARKIKRITSQ